MLLPLLLACSMLAPDALAAARDRATLHGQIEIVKAEPARTQPGQTLVHGIVRVIYRQKPGSLKLGDEIAFWVDTRYREQRSPPGEDVRLAVEDLRTGRLLDAFLDPAARTAGQPAVYTVVLGQVSFSE